MNGWLLDTHIWYWHLVGSSKLPGSVRDLIDRHAERCRLSPISVWEIGMLCAKSRIELTMDFERWVEAALERLPLGDAPMNHAVARRALQIQLPHRDPADAFLAATAAVFELELVTVDQRLQHLPGVRIFQVR